jgi:hypothetical protein
MQAINLLMSADQPAPDESGVLRSPDANLFFILGIDRGVVAAGIAAKNRDILPYIIAGENRSSEQELNLSRAGLDFGYRFLEKFIQVPFRLPEIDSRSNPGWVAKLLRADDPPAQSETPAPPPDWSDPNERPSFFVGTDVTHFIETADEVIGVLRFNPRRAKQFINVFRLQLLMLIEAGAPLILDPDHRPRTEQDLTIRKVGLVLGIFLRWPLLIRDLGEYPDLLAQLQALRDDKKIQMGPVMSFWAAEPMLMDILHLTTSYDLSYAALRGLLDLLPVTTRPRWTDGRQAPRANAPTTASTEPSRPNPPSARNAISEARDIGSEKDVELDELRRRTFAETDEPIVSVEKEDFIRTPAPETAPSSETSPYSINIPPGQAGDRIRRMVS